jgi:hypothetical protein
VIAELILEYLRVIVSWPVAITALGPVFFVKFQTPISAVIHRIASIRVGGGELLTAQVATNVTDALPPPPPCEPVPEAAAGQGEAGEAEDGAEDIAEQRFRSERERATLWEYRYLN